MGTSFAGRSGTTPCHPQSTALTTFTSHTYLFPRDESLGNLPKGLASVKFRSERDALVDMLATAEPCRRRTWRLVAGAPGPAVTCTGNALSVTGTDLDLTIQVTDEVIGIDDGSCVIPARLSTDIVRRLEPGAVTLADDGDHITISAARSTFKLQTYPVVEFPPVGKTSEPMTQLSESALGEAVRQVVRAASHDDGRPLLTGVLVSRVDGFAAHGGDGLVPHGHAGPARSQLPFRAKKTSSCRHEPSPSSNGCPPGPSPKDRRPTGSASRPAATRSPFGRATSRSARASSRGATRTTSN